MKLNLLTAKLRLCALLLLSLCAFTDTTQAATLQVEVLVPGYSSYALVIPTSNTGGRVVRASSGQLFTDRVARGETIRLRLSPTPGDFNKGGQAFGVAALYGGAWYNYTQLSPYSSGFMPWTSGGIKVPLNPAMDRLEVHIQTLGEDRNQSLPLGRR